MKITWLGHSCFKIESNNESIILDPYKDNSVNGLSPLNQNANIVLCSHKHDDHYGKECIHIDPKECHYHISTISTYHDDQKGALRGTNTIHIIEDKQYKVVHLGDLGCSLTQEQISQLKGADLVLIPVGGFYTINALQAKEIVDQIQPKITIPMHYRMEHIGYPVLDTVDSFTKLFDSYLVKKENSILVEDNLNNPVIVLSI